MRKKVYIAYTGGTIGMKPTEDGFVPAAAYLQQLMDNLPELKSDLLPEYQIDEYEPLLDSSNMTPADWLKIATDISKRHNAFDGFVVLHGTDTMAYTASALPFMLQGLKKPVVITGAQIPLCRVRNDARTNLITALLIIPAAAARPLARTPESMVGFALLIGAAAALGGLAFSFAFDTPTGPTIVSLAAFLFAASHGLSALRGSCPD